MHVELTKIKLSQGIVFLFNQPEFNSDPSFIDNVIDDLGSLCNYPDIYVNRAIREN
jgi:hypothetical protein